MGEPCLLRVAGAVRRTGRRRTQCRQAPGWRQRPSWRDNELPGVPGGAGNPPAAVLGRRRAERVLAACPGDVAMPLPKPIVIGNWKMNGLRADAVERVEALLGASAAAGARGHARHLPAGDAADAWSASCCGTARCCSAARTARAAAKGAHTGDLSAEMLKDAGCQLGDRRPLGAAPWPRRERCAGARQGRGGARRRPDADPVHRRDRGRVGRRRDPRRARPPARRQPARGRRARTS